MEGRSRVSILIFDPNGKVEQYHPVTILGTWTPVAKIKVGDRITELNAVVVDIERDDRSITFTCQYSDGTKDTSKYALADYDYINPPEA
jgi:hypothetical protein